VHTSTAYSVTTEATVSIRQGLLALLSERPMHGYQLRQEFEARTGGTWPLNIGQAYTTLQRLERDGLVEPVHDDEPDSPERYRLTEAGRTEVSAWWSRPVERKAPARDELAIKLALAVTVPGVDVAAVVQRQRTETLRALRDYTRLKRDTSPDAGGLAWALVLESLIYAAEAEVRWLDHVESTVARAAAERPHAPTGPTAGANATRGASTGVGQRDGAR
jgi:DNA-binding PadR family transcriptional regulator